MIRRASSYAKFVEIICSSDPTPHPPVEHDPSVPQPSVPHPAEHFD
jgi:hypothetical protein